MREPLQRIPRQQHGYSMPSFSPDGRWLSIATYDGELSIYEAGSLAPVAKAPLLGRMVERILFTPDAEFLAAMSKM